MGARVLGIESSPERAASPPSLLASSPPAQSSRSRGSRVGARAFGPTSSTRVASASRVPSERAARGRGAVVDLGPDTTRGSKRARRSLQDESPGRG